ncbi:hypothetical protein EJB05_41512, partial [Eragrostis curvula]
MAATQSPLRRWKRFFATFDAVDAAIPAPGPGQRAGDEVLRKAKADVVQLLCDASEDDEAEDLCRILDDVMVDYLVALKSAPVTPRALASTGLAKAVGALPEHESEKIRGLARDIVAGWREKKQQQVKEMTKIACIVRVEPVKRDSPAKISAAPLPKKSAPVVVGADHASMDRMMEATKRKLREGYQEAADAKRQRKIVVIDAPPKMAEKRKVHPIIRERSQARSTTTTIVRSVPKVSKPVVDGLSVWASKPTADGFPVWASKPAANGFPVWASKPAAEDGGACGTIAKVASK